LTTAHHSPDVEVTNVEGAVEVLKAQGLRVSAARRLLLEALFAAGGPVTAEQIAAGSGGRVPESDVGSVYRNLELLERVGLVRHAHLGHGPAVYALAGKLAPAYLVCERCGGRRALTDKELEPLRRSIHKRFGYEARFRHFPITGLCETCAARLGSEARQG
jgi:Fur family transcriptional regulator, ferric uptake regulator